MSGARAFLDVSSSETGLAWRPRLDAQGEARALAIAQVGGVSEIVARVLAARAVEIDGVARFLSPKLRDLMPDPYTLTDMAKATERLKRAVLAGEGVGIFGDYDVDGAASSALLSEYLEACGLATLIHIPDRILEGYGPNRAAMEAFVKRGVSLVVTVDCGATSAETFAHAKSLGLDVVVFDHHQAPEAIPDVVALVDPNRQDDLSGLGTLCAAGVVYMGLVALSRALREAGFFKTRAAPNLLAALDLVALATVADVVPLTGLNRAFVVQGLAVMRERKRPGLTALLDVAAADGPPTPYHLGFMVGPRVNAGGRIGDAALGARLLTTRDDLLAREIAAELDRLNRIRQEIEIAALAEAEAEALHALGLEERGACVVVGGESWPPGIVGLVAARLKERFGRPAFAFALQGAEAVGSGRSIQGVDLGRTVRAIVDAGLALKGGGHAMAAGVTIERGRLGEFRAYLEVALAAPVERARAGPTLLIDSALSAQAATPDLVTAVEAAGPFGSGSPEPMFALPSHRLTDVFPVGTNHLRLRAASMDGRKIEAIAFRAGDKPLGEALRRLKGQAVHLAGTLSINRYGGRETAQLRVVDVAKAERAG